MPTNSVFLFPQAMRQSELWLKYRFICSCQRCSSFPPTYVDRTLQVIVPSPEKCQHSFILVTAKWFLLFSSSRLSFLFFQLCVLAEGRGIDFFPPIICIANFTIGHVLFFKYFYLFFCMQGHFCFLLVMLFNKMEFASQNPVGFGNSFVYHGSNLKVVYLSRK